MTHDSVSVTETAESVTNSVTGQRDTLACARLSYGEGVTVVTRDKTRRDSHGERDIPPLTGERHADGSQGQKNSGPQGAAGNRSAISFIVAGQPQGKGRPRIGKVGAFSRMFTPAETVAYENLIAYTAQMAMLAQGRSLLDEPVGVRMHLDCQVPASWSDKKRRAALAGSVLPTSKPDADNVVKAVFDALNGVLWRDDVLVVDLAVRKRFSLAPAVRVEVWPIAGAPGELGGDGVQGDLLGAAA